MKRSTRRKLDFIAGVLITIAILLNVSLGILWLCYYDTLMWILFICSILLSYLSACCWYYKPNKKRRRG